MGRPLTARHGSGNARRAVTLGGFAVMIGLVATPVIAEPHELCPTRPGLDTPSCIVDPGHALLELGLADWTLDRGAGARTDTIATGQVLLRYGIDERTEVQLGWTAYGHRRIRDATGITDTGGVGDVTLALKRSLGEPNGPVAIQAYVSAPTGGEAIGAGDWQAGVLLPVSIPLPNDFELGLTPEVDWLANEDGKGHHFAYGTAFGVSKELAKSVTFTVEGKVTHDDEPGNRMTPVLASASLAWQTDDDDQFDIGVVKGVADAPDIEVYVGVSRRF